MDKENSLMAAALATLSAVVLVGVVIFISSCGKPPVPPGPNPATDFAINGKTVQFFDGKLEAGTSISLDEVKRTLKTAVDIIDSK